MTNRGGAHAAILSVLFAILPVAGCSMAWPASEMLPPASVVGRRVPVPPASVRIYREGTRTDRPIVQIAKVAAHGNGYATRATLEKTLVQQAAQLGADAVVIVGQETTKDETVGSYGGGIVIANQIQRPHLYGIAVVWQKVRVGVNCSAKDGQRTIDYVTHGSAAERAGIREGEKLLAIDGQFVGADEFEFERVFYQYNPGDTATFELLDNHGEKRSVRVTFDSVQ
jgi:S1-C subfamily serine protease